MATPVDYSVQHSIDEAKRMNLTTDEYIRKMREESLLKESSSKDTSKKAR